MPDAALTDSTAMLATLPVATGFGLRHRGPAGLVRSVVAAPVTGGGR